MDAHSIARAARRDSESMTRLVIPGVDPSPASRLYSEKNVGFRPVPAVTHQNLIFVHGKGGVGKTSISQALALSLSRRDGNVLWCEFENPNHQPGHVERLSPRLTHLNIEATLAFEEYAEMKIENLGFGLGTLGSMGLSRVFTKNRLIQYLAKAAPGIHELVLLGKTWHEREKYDHVVVDMPSTGHALALFQSTINFARLFGGGPISRDADAMLRTIGDPERTGHLIIALPEEMPLRESIELRGHLAGFFPLSPPAFLLNRRFPTVRPPTAAEVDVAGPPFARSIQDYAARRSALEAQNIRIWVDEGLEFGEVALFPPSQGEAEARGAERGPEPGQDGPVVERITGELERKKLV